MIQNCVAIRTILVIIKMKGDSKMNVSFPVLFLFLVAITVLGSIGQIWLKRNEPVIFYNMDDDDDYYHYPYC